MSEPVPSAHRCHVHPEREAYISCQRCERPICPHCMTEASVGFQCPTCVIEGAEAVRAPRTIGGGTIQGREGVVSLTLIGINVAVFVVTGILGFTAVSTAGGMIAPNVRDPLSGTVYPGLLDGGYWRLITSAFLHASFLHLAFNMVALYLFGPFAERALGTRRFIIAYLTMAVFSAGVVYLLSDFGTFTVGASGAVFGLFGFALVVLIRMRQDVRTLLLLLLINAAISFTGNISWQGHLGGFLAGLVIGGVVAYGPPKRRTEFLAFAIAGLLIATIVMVYVRTAMLTG